ncbi:hypothetical protein LguiA_028926 [Lonicera macranthoides]
MDSDSKPMFINGIANINSNSTITELISFTQSAFRPSDFELVERTLIARELEMKKKHADTVLVNLEMELELDKYKKEVEGLRKIEQENKELILQLNEEIKEAKCATYRSDSEVEAGKKKFKDLEQRVGCLEEDNALFRQSRKKDLNLLNRAQKNLSAIGLWEKSKVATIEAELKKIEVTIQKLQRKKEEQISFNYDSVADLYDDSVDEETKLQ